MTGIVLLVLFIAETATVLMGARCVRTLDVTRGPLLVPPDRGEDQRDQAPDEHAPASENVGAAASSEQKEAAVPSPPAASQRCVVAVDRQGAPSERLGA